MKQSSFTTERWGTLGLALGAGLAAALLAYVLVRGHAGPLRGADRTISIVVAASDIPMRSRLTATMLRLSRIPQPQFTSEFLTERPDLIGRITVAEVAAGQPVKRSAIAAPDADLGMAFSVPPKQRAVTIPLDPAAGVGGFAQPGDHVDILATTDVPGSSQSETRTVLQNIPLLAVGSRTSAETQSPTSDTATSNVTVAVSPAEAQALVLWANRGKLHLALRPPQEAALSNLPLLRSQPVVHPPRPVRRSVPKPHSLPSLPPLATAPMPVALAAVPLPSRITVIKGTQVQTLTVSP